MDDKQIIDFLKQEDAETISVRAERLKYILEREEQGHRLFFGGEMSLYAYQEAKCCFVAGHYIASVMLSQIVLEYIMGSFFRMVGRDDLERAKFKKVLDLALEERFITEEEHAAFDKLRKKRNPYGHYRSPVDEESIMMRRIKENKDAEDLFYQDAKLALTAVIRLLNRTLFYFPDKINEEA